MPKAVLMAGRWRNLLRDLRRAAMDPTDPLPPENATEGHRHLSRKEMRERSPYVDNLCRTIDAAGVVEFCAVCGMPAPRSNALCRKCRRDARRAHQRIRDANRSERSKEKRRVYAREYRRKRAAKESA